MGKNKYAFIFLFLFLVIGKDGKGNLVQGTLESAGLSKLVVGTIDGEMVVGNEISPGFFRVVGRDRVYEVGRR